MTIIFKAKTTEGYCWKILAELLQSNMKDACFEVDEQGIRLRMMDYHQTILIDLEMEADNFTIYKFRAPEKMYLGINLLHFHKMLKSIKKKDSIQFFINDLSPTDLGIKVIPEKNNRVTTSFIKIQTMQNIEITVPEGYNKPVIVPSGEFQKMCKGLTHISDKTHITSRGFMINFSTDAGGVMKRSTEFGECEDSDSDVEDSKDEEDEYSEYFDTEQLTKITKLAGLSHTMQIYPCSENPLLFRSSIGSLGRISVYLKSKNLREAEAREDSDDEY